jgi:hypothetical protein
MCGRVVSMGRNATKLPTLNIYSQHLQPEYGSG